MTHVVRGGLAALLAVLVLPTFAAAALTRTAICHKPGSAKQRILLVGPDDLAKHFAHGDYLVMAEVCDGADNDCDGLVDEGFSSQPEVCDGFDNNCNGFVDEDFPVGDACEGVGACGTGTRECAGPSATRCSTDPGGSQDASQPETCDRLDNDCDGFVDEDFEGVGLPCIGLGVCHKQGTLECGLSGVFVLQCSTSPGGSEDQSQSETCDGLDNDCDGEVDDGLCCPATCTDSDCGPKDDGCGDFISCPCFQCVFTCSNGVPFIGQCGSREGSCGSSGSTLECELGCDSFCPAQGGTCVGGEMCAQCD